MSNLESQMENILIHCQSQDGNIRSQAEQQIQLQMFQNTLEFYTNIVKLIVNPQIPITNRNYACTFMSMSIQKQNNNNVYLWNTLDESFQNQIRDAIVAQLTIDDQQFRRVIAQVISQIAVLDIPAGKWPSLLTSLQCICSDNSQANQKHKTTAIMTVGYIADKLSEHKVKSLNSEQQQQILTSICMGIKKEYNNTPEIKKHAIKALKDSLCFLQELMQAQNIRDATLLYITELIGENDEEIVICALQALIEFSKYFYNVLNPYIPTIYATVKPALFSKKEQFVVPCTEIWDSIMIEYKNRKESNNQQIDYLQIQISEETTEPLFYKLAVIFLQNLVDEQSDQNDDVLSQIQESSERALVSLVEIQSDYVIDIFQTFISGVFGKPEGFYKQAAVIAYGCIVEGGYESNSSKVRNCIQSPFQAITQLLNDPNEKLQVVVSRSVQKVADFDTQLISGSDNINTFIQLFRQSLKRQPEVSQNMCYIFNFLANNMKTQEQYEKTKFRPFIEDVLKDLYQNACRQDLANDMTVVDVSFMAMMDILHYARDSNLCYQWLKQLMSDFEQTYGITDQRKTYIQSGLLSVIHGAILGTAFTTSMEQAAVDTLFNLIDTYFKKVNAVTSDGLYVLSALITVAKEMYNIYADKTYAYLVQALDPQNSDLMKTALQCIGDLSRGSSTNGTFDRHSNIIETLICYIQDQNLNANIKIHVINAVGDLSLSNKSASVHFDKLINMYNLSFQAVIQLINTPNKSQSIISYIEDLQYALIDSYTCFTHGMSENGSEQIRGFLVQNFQNLFEFIKYTSNKSQNPTVEFLRYCINLISDYVNFYHASGHLINICKQEDIFKNLAKVLTDYQISHPNQENSDTIQYAQEALKRIYG